MYIEHLTIRQLRCFDQAETTFSVPAHRTGDDTGGLTLFVGDNGAGKSTLLRAVCLAALSGIIDQSGLIARHLVRRGGSGEAQVEARLRLHRQDVPSLPEGESVIEQASTHLVRRGDTERLESRQVSDLRETLYRDDDPGFLVLGYGATRRVDSSEVFDPDARRRGRLPRYQRVAGLFEEHTALTPLHAWGKLHDQRRDEIVAIFDRILPPEVHYTGDIEGGEPIFDYYGGRVPFEALSDGYRGFIGLIGDILYHLATVAPAHTPLDSLRGILLIDEIALHLHPSWQRTVLGDLVAAFPRLQLLATSHSPLVVGTVQPCDLRLLALRPDAGQPWPAVEIRELEEAVHGLGADQILTSAFFGLDTTRAPTTRTSLRELARRAADGDAEAGLEYLRTLAGTGASARGPESDPEDIA